MRSTSLQKTSKLPSSSSSGKDKDEEKTLEKETLKLESDTPWESKAISLLLPMIPVPNAMNTDNRILSLTFKSKDEAEAAFEVLKAQGLNMSKETLGLFQKEVIVKKEPEEERFKSLEDRLLRLENSLSGSSQQLQATIKQQVDTQCVLKAVVDQLQVISNALVGHRLPLKPLPNTLQPLIRVDKPLPLLCKPVKTL